MAAILAQNALTVLERVRADLGLSVTTSDEKILRAINSASALIERYCGRIFWRDTAVEEDVAGYGTTQMRLARRPINSIDSIDFNSDEIDSGDYSISDAGAGLVTKIGGWHWTAYLANDISRGILPGTERQLYTATYDGGWYTPGQARARGTITFTDVPTADDDMVVNLTTITAKAATPGDNEFLIAADARASCDNLAAAINAGDESDNVRAWRVGLAVVVEWLEGGADGNGVIFTESMDNALADGTGLLGGTQTGVTQTLPDDLEDACAEFARSIFLAKNRDPSVVNERLTTWSASYGMGGGKGISQGGRAAGFPNAVARVIDLYKALV